MRRIAALSLVLMTALSGCYLSAKPVFDGPGVETGLSEGTYNCAIPSSGYRGEYTVLRSVSESKGVLYTFDFANEESKDVDSSALLYGARTYVPITEDMYGVSFTTEEANSAPVFANLLAEITGTSIRYITFNRFADTRAKQLEEALAHKANITIEYGVQYLPDAARMKVENEDDQRRAREYFTKLASAIKDNVRDHVWLITEIAVCTKAQQ